MISLSTCLVNRLAGQSITVTDAGSQIAFIAATNRITTTQSDFLTKGFRPGLVIKIESSSNNNGLFTLTQVASDGSYMVTSESLTDEAASTASPTISVVNGHSWLTVFRYGILDLYSSPMPSDADSAETGTKLASYTVSAGSFTPGTSTNGIQLEFDAAGKIKILTSQTIQGNGLVDGTAYYARLYDNAHITGDDSSNLQSPRVQGRVATSGMDFDISSTSIKAGIRETCDAINITLPTSKTC